MLQIYKTSLNAISHNCAIGMIRRVIDDDFDIREIYVDTVGDSNHYQTRLSALFPAIEITVTPKADSLFPIVGAASICAKVTRDKCVSSWKFPETMFVSSSPLGSGYPGDPDTKAWLEKHLDPVFGFPNIARFSWSTIKTLLDDRGLKVDWHEEEETRDPAQLTLTLFVSKNRRSEYFESAGLEIVQDL
eukprot:c14893_g1_i1.p1 GENE.c14893_g1_i1~~c14893_g1_i1.p1  ORF type:complete len:189 (+),score=43.02 c14893_g1_i1:251-817(+)